MRLAVLMLWLFSARYQELNPAPEWAQSARNKLHKRPKRRRASSVTSSGASENEEPVAELDDLLRNTDGLVSRGDRPKAVPAGTIAVERLRDANNSAPAEGGITCIKFHPSPAVPVMLATGNDKRMRLFNVFQSPFLRRENDADPRMTDRRPHKSTPPNPPYLRSRTHNCPLPPLRFDRPTHRDKTLLLYIRPPVQSGR